MGISRVGNNQLVRNIQFNIKSQLDKQSTLFEQISSNKRILSPSDDPVGTSQAMHHRDQLVQNNEFTDVIETANLWTNITTTALDDAVNTWKRVNELGIAASDGTKSEADRIAMAEELEQLLQHLVQIGNTTNGQRFVFGGSKTNAPPFDVEKDPNTGRVTGVFYQGDQFKRMVKTKNFGDTQVNALGSNSGDPNSRGAFVDSTSETNSFETLIKLRDKLLDNDIIGLSGTGGLLKKVEDVGYNLVTAQVMVGGTQERLELDRNRVIQENADIKQFLSEVEDADIAALILELNNAQNVYDAALAAGGRLIQTGLLNYI